MRRGELLRGLCLAAAFVLLGVCLLAAGRGMAAAEGIRITDAELPGGKGTLYLPRETAAVTLPAHEEGEETLSAGGMSSAALILSRWPDGARAAAAELCRRGVAVLTVPQGTDVRAAWDWLVSRPGVRGDSAAILAGAHRAPEALALAKALAGTPRECAALVLAGDKSLVKAAAGSPAANILLITGQEASPEELTAFYGAEVDARRGFTGFFSEKTARAAAAVGGRRPRLLPPRRSDAGPGLAGQQSRPPGGAGRRRSALGEDPVQPGGRVDVLFPRSRGPAELQKKETV